MLPKSNYEKNPDISGKFTQSIKTKSSSRHLSKGINLPKLDRMMIKNGNKQSINSPI